VTAFAQQTNTPDPQLRQALGALYTKSAVEVTDQGPIYGRQAIEKAFCRPVSENPFQQLYR
jgi:hypothetical protein